ncbi:coiled-coil domain-containing protein 113 [Anthonomus grandis grandis]|uniref:coiled-coil domain-containing protein 113 n=1 Tax=Anthonomus grandis grandis TaxID=2921223 RepID=UPI0021659A0D|nr:coiled-coil domain-containing protein 113 [Anthonomus grandis grandis]
MSEENEKTSIENVPLEKPISENVAPQEEEQIPSENKQVESDTNAEETDQENSPPAAINEEGGRETEIQKAVDEDTSETPEIQDLNENAEQIEKNSNKELDQKREEHNVEGPPSDENAVEPPEAAESVPPEGEIESKGQVSDPDDDYIKPPVQEEHNSDVSNFSNRFDIESTTGEEVEQETHPLDELTDQQVIDLVQELETENRHLQLENILFETFINDNDPSLMEGIDDIMNLLLGKKQSLESGGIPSRSSMLASDRAKYRLDSYTSITSIAEGKGPKINLSQKTDMVMRAMEENQSRLEAFMKKCHIIKRNLKAELEEFSIREAEIKEATDIFEFNVVTQGLDKLTQRIPAEKFIRYMEEWLKSAQLQIEKLRLRIATLKVQYKKVSQQLIQRQELGENVHAVDFDQLEIENKHFIQKIEQKNIHLIELKKMNGGANLVLSIHKKFLQRQQDDCNKLQSEISEKNRQIEETEKEVDVGKQELEAEIEKFENCKNLKSKYTVPDVMEYVRLKAKLHDLRKNIKIWTRRRKIQDIALNTCLREMKNLTGRTDIDLSWFEDPDEGMDDSSLLDELI